MAQQQKMEWLGAAGYEKQASEAIGPHEMLLYRRGKVDVALLRIVGVFSASEMGRYASLHRALFRDRTSRGLRVALLYDVRDGTTPGVDVIAQKKELHSSMSSIYEGTLVSTVIIVSSETIKSLINSFFTKIYKPVRPVHFVNNADELCAALT